MKTYIINILFLLPFVCFAQTRIDVSGDYIRNNTVGKNNLPKDIIGSPYIDESFKQGTVKISQEISENKLLRYNAYTDDVEFLGDNNTAMLVPKTLDVEAKINGKTYKVFENPATNALNYFLVKNKGTLKLLVKNTKTIQEAVKAETGYQQDKPARFIDVVTYFIATDDKLKEVRIKEKDILNTLTDYPEAAKFIKENKLKIKNEDDLIVLLNHLNNTN